MNIKKINSSFSVSDQLCAADVHSLVASGFTTIICNRPDGEDKQPVFSEILESASDQGIKLHYLPVTQESLSVSDVRAFKDICDNAPGPVLAYCRSGQRSMTLWSLARIAEGISVDDCVAAATVAGFDFNEFKTKNAANIKLLTAPSPMQPGMSKGIDAGAHETSFQVVIVGAGASGVSVASSLLARDKYLRIALIDPAETHYYQPGFTMVGGGIFKSEQNKRSMATLIPQGVTWIQAAAERFEPDNNALVLSDGSRIHYKRMIVCPGIKLNWSAIEGLTESLGKNGVTSNYRADLAPYTWELVQNLKQGVAVFTQPPMPIKCAGAPQKALYLSADHWLQQHVLQDIQIKFFNAGAVLFGVKDYVPALQSYMDKYKAELNFMHRLVKVDGDKKTAWFEKTDANGMTTQIKQAFDMIHVCPPQSAPDFIRNSPLADAAGWVDVDPVTLQHKRYSNIWGLGDATNTPNAKTAAAVRKQVPVVAANIINDIKGLPQEYQYDGYGSCPLTVERGKIVLAEFAYGGKLAPSLPNWVLNGTHATSLAWHMKKSMLPPLYWHGMLKGHELLVKPVRKIA
ncbi:MAG: TIGR01244 family sulfur transferase [Pseudohongiella sp.]|nr:TIGR01244 family sulfur transferase [Pseudohongiella sp.]